MSEDSLRVFGSALMPPVRIVHQKPRDIPATKAKLKRVAEHATESMVKVTGGARSVQHLKSHMDYISRNGNLVLEDERGEVLNTRDLIRDTHGQWAAELGKTRANERHTINIVLSMPKGTDPEHVLAGARSFAKDQFGKTNQYLMALHHPGNDEKTKNPHVHLTVKARGYDGKKLDPKKAQLFSWREAFAEKMRELNYNVEATPRRSRGVVKKPVKFEIQQMLNDKERPGRSKVFRNKVNEAGDLLQGKKVKDNPAKDNIKKQQSGIRENYRAAIKELEKSPKREDKALAESVKKFVSTLPKVLEDERTTLARSMKEGIDRSRPKAKEQSKDTGKER
jgi:type IV secretion system T-DNA border endonuclease VirD2